MTVHRKPGDPTAIARQAELLATARHLGVVELVGVEGSPDRPVLVTRRVDGPTLATPVVLSAEEVAGVAGALISTLADLHELGIAHGAVAPEHVLVTDGGRPVLCGWGSAGHIGQPRPGGGDELHAADDVAAFGRLLRRLATGPDARVLRRIAATATVDDPGARPTAREVAAALASAMPGARLPIRGVAPPAPRPVADLRSLVAGARSDRGKLALPRRRPTPTGSATGPVAPPEESTEPSSRRPDPGTPRRRGSPVRSGALVGGVAAVAAVGLVVLAPWSSTGATDERRIVTPSTPTTPTTLSVRSTPTSTDPPPASSSVPTPRSDCPVPASVLVADIDGDGCLDAVRYSDGVLEAAGQRWSLGRAGDQVATGDWSCGGVRTVVLLRPSTGEVFRFDTWATGAVESAVAPAIAIVPGGQAVRAADVDRDGCHDLVVERGELPPQVVRLPRSRP